MDGRERESLGRRLRLWTVATLVQAGALVVGLVVTEALDADLRGGAFTSVLFLSVFVLAPLMLSTPLSLLVALRYAWRLRRASRRGP